MEFLGNTSVYFQEVSEGTANTVYAFRETLVFPPGDTPTSATHLSTSVAARIQERGRGGGCKRLRAAEPGGRAVASKLRRVEVAASIRHGRHGGFLRTFHRDKETRRGGNGFHTLVHPSLSLL